MRIRILSFLMMLCLLLCCTACGSGGGEVTDTATSSVTEMTMEMPVETEAPVADLIVVDVEGKTSFTIVRGDEADGMTKNIAITLHTTINHMYSAKVGLSSDITAKKDADGYVTNGNYEILIGDTNRRETAEAMEELGDHDYLICVKGNKLVILGKTAYATKYAVNLFMKDFLQKKQEALVIPGDTVLTGSGMAQSVALTEGADLRIMTFNLLGGGENPERRYPNIQETILTYLPDVIGFQEANGGQYPGVLNQLKMYAKVETEMPSSCTPILYRKDKYTQIDGGCEFLDSRYTGTSTKSMMWVVLRSNETGKTFCVINLHGAVLSNSYSGYEGMSSAEMNAIVSVWRVDNVRQMLAKCAEIEAKYGDLPVMFTGDFNFNSSSEAYRAVLAAGLTEAEVSATGKRVTGIGTWHTVGVAPGNGKSIDHIFYDPSDVTALRHHIANAEGFEIDASDHCAVWADVKLMK